MLCMGDVFLDRIYIPIGIMRNSEQEVFWTLAGRYFVSLFWDLTSQVNIANCAADQDSFPNKLIDKLTISRKKLGFITEEELNCLGTADIQTHFMWHTRQKQDHSSKFYRRSIQICKYGDALDAEQATNQDYSQRCHRKVDVLDTAVHN